MTIKTKTFIKKVEELGYLVKLQEDTYRVVTPDGFKLARVSEDRQNNMDTNYCLHIPDNLFEVLVEYARTPIEERVDKKLYGVSVITGGSIEGFMFDSILSTYEEDYGGTFQNSFIEEPYKRVTQSRAVELPTSDKEIADAIALLSGGRVYEVLD